MPVRTTRPRVEKKMPSSSLTWQQGRAGVSPASSAFTSAANDVSSGPPGLDFLPPTACVLSVDALLGHNQSHVSDEEKPGPTATARESRATSSGLDQEKLLTMYRQMVLAR